MKHQVINKALIIAALTGNGNAEGQLVSFLRHGYDSHHFLPVVTGFREEAAIKAFVEKFTFAAP